MEISAPAKDWQGDINKADNLTLHTLHLLRPEGENVCLYTCMVLANGVQVLVDNKVRQGYNSIELSLGKEW